MRDLSTGFYQAAVACLMTSLLTGIGAWLAFGHQQATRADLESMRSEMRDFVAERSPWTIERGEVLAAVHTNAGQIAVLSDDVQRLVDSQHALMIDQRVLLTKVEAMLGESLNRVK